jgi:Ca-activated chloride channel family protein
MSEFEFLRLDVLWIAAAALAAVAAWRWVRRKRYVAFSAVAWLDRVAPRPSPFRRLSGLLIAAGFGLTVMALTEPVLRQSESVVTLKGLDIVLLLDLSSSMHETMDFSTPGTPGSRTRLERTKAALRDFIRRRRDDRIGLVVFSANAYVVSPLTFDYDYLLNYVDMVDDQILRGESMTAIGDGMALSNYLLARQSGERGHDKVIVVFTDGENNSGRDPLDVLEESAAAGVRVYMVGVDIGEGIKRRPSLQTLVNRMRRHGGQYYTADTVRQLRTAYTEINALEKSSLTSKALVRDSPVFAWFAMPALIFVAAGLGLRAIPYFADLT